MLPGYFHFRPRRPLLGGLYYAAAFGPLCAACVLAGVAASTDRVALGVLLAIGVSALWLFPAFLLALKGRRLLAPSAREVLAVDDRAPVLFLRGFEEEAAKMPVGGELYEESLAKVFKRLGPVLAVGRPGARLPELGAARLYLDHDDWQRGVRFLLERAQLVVLQVADSEGVAWEIEQVLGAVRRERLVLYFPAVQGLEARPLLRRIARWSPDLALVLARRVYLTIRVNERRVIGAFDRARAEVRQAKWQRFRDRFGHLLPVPLPQRIGEAVFLVFDADGSPRLLEMAATGPDDGDVQGDALIEAALTDVLTRAGATARRPPR